MRSLGRLARSGSKVEQVHLLRQEVGKIRAVDDGMLCTARTVDGLEESNVDCLGTNWLWQRSCSDATMCPREHV
jgi:hypothetical protein